MKALLEALKNFLELLWGTLGPSEETLYAMAASSMMCDGYTDVEILEALGPDPRNSSVQHTDSDL